MTTASGVLSSLVTHPVAGRIVLGPLARRGYRSYLTTGETPRLSYVAMRKLYAADPAAFDRLAALSTREHAPLQLSSRPNGLLAGRIDEAVATLDRDGVYVLPEPIDAVVCAELTELASSVDCELVGDGVERRRARFDPDHPAAPRYDVAEVDLARHRAVQRFMADESLLAVAQRYLRAAPIHDLVAMWWTAAWNGASSAAAQKFHFDLDRLRFLKLFVYLTDVDEQSGPHVYVKGTHRELGRKFRRDRRHEDADVERCYEPAMTTIVGATGTAFLADTRGLHKGNVVERGHRLVFQLEYASSLFGQSVNHFDLGEVTAELQSAIERYPSAFERFSSVPPRAND